jgi:thiosulfate dehydrogenase (quinone) large subunit
MTTDILVLNGSPLKAPPLITFVFSDKRMAGLWLLVRLWLGWQWLETGIEKVTDPGWMQTGEALKGFWTRAVQVPAEGRPPISYDWYRGFIQMMLDSNAYVWFAKIVAVSEVVLGVALILGIFVGLTAFFAGFMNWNFIMAGSASVNGIFLVLAVLLILAWKIAGYLGVDYFLLPRIASLWTPVSTNNITTDPIQKTDKSTNKKNTTKKK